MNNVMNQTRYPSVKIQRVLLCYMRLFNCSLWLVIVSGIGTRRGKLNTKNIIFCNLIESLQRPILPACE
jgi:hypothetical protein